MASSSSSSSKTPDTAVDTNAAPVQQTRGRPGVSAGVMAKLIGFSLAMFILPILTFYTTVDGVFGGNTTYAAGSAAVVANVVVIGYVIVAFMEDPDKDKKE
ncbi:hypothetical protein CLU79DRAFT_716547 [Phycomyces nitens]|nr:hypothetical protein CLU79DRAFT_716547 [Phycomyces nitens]